MLRSPTRRRWLRRGSGGLIAIVSASLVPPLEAGEPASGAAAAPNGPPRTLWTFGDSVLDSGRYNPHGLDPGRLIVRNEDRLFAEFHGRDLQSRGRWRLEHRAVDGATVDDLAGQAKTARAGDGSLAIVSVGGNDLLRGLAADRGGGLLVFERTLRHFLDALPIRPLFLATVYDPTFGDDSRNFLAIPAAVARGNHQRLNAILAEIGHRLGGVADLHAHFLGGDLSWFTNTIEPSLVGSSEIRRVFLALM